MTESCMLQSNKKPARLPIAARRFSAVEAPCLPTLWSGTTGPVIVTYTPYSFLSFRYSCRGPCCPQNLYSGGISVARCFLYCYVQSRPVQTWNILVDSSSGIKKQLSIVEIHHFAHAKQKSIYFLCCPPPHPALFSESSGTRFIKLPII